MPTMLTRSQKVVLLLAAGILLFVVLCPATPTPTAVVKNQSILILLLFTPVFALLWKPTSSMFLGVEDLLFDQHDSGHSILDLTCTRLC